MSVWTVTLSDIVRCPWSLLILCHLNHSRWMLIIIMMIMMMEVLCSVVLILGSSSEPSWLLWLAAATRSGQSRLCRDRAVPAGQRRAHWRSRGWTLRRGDAVARCLQLRKHQRYRAVYFEGCQLVCQRQRGTVHNLELFISRGANLYAKDSEVQSTI